MIRLPAPCLGPRLPHKCLVLPVPGLSIGAFHKEIPALKHVDLIPVWPCSSQYTAKQPLTTRQQVTASQPCDRSKHLPLACELRSARRLPSPDIKNVAKRSLVSGCIRVGGQSDCSTAPSDKYNGMGLSQGAKVFTSYLRPSICPI